MKKTKYILIVLIALLATLGFSQLNENSNITQAQAESFSGCNILCEYDYGHDEYDSYLDISPQSSTQSIDKNDTKSYNLKEER